MRTIEVFSIARIRQVCAISFIPVPNMLRQNCVRTRFVNSENAVHTHSFFLSKQMAFSLRYSSSRSRMPTALLPVLQE